jgi:hypothetical protein
VMGRGLFCTLFLFLPCCNEFFMMLQQMIFKY